MYVALVAGVASLALAIFFAFHDRGPAKVVGEAVREAGAKAKKKLENPVQEQAAIDFASLAKLADSLHKLDRSGRFLVAALGFIAVAAAVIGADTIAS